MAIVMNRFERLPAERIIAACIGCEVDELPDFNATPATPAEQQAEDAFLEHLARLPPWTPQDQHRMLDGWARTGIPDYWQAVLRRAGVLR